MKEVLRHKKCKQGWVFIWLQLADERLKLYPLYSTGLSCYQNDDDKNRITHLPSIGSSIG